MRLVLVEFKFLKKIEYFSLFSMRSPLFLQSKIKLPHPLTWHCVGSGIGYFLIIHVFVSKGVKENVKALVGFVFILSLEDFQRCTASLT